MLYSESGGFAFVHIQKTAGTSVRKALEAAFPDLRRVGGTHDGAREARAALGEAEWGRLFRFAFVRDPWDRLVSWHAMIVAREADDPWYFRLRGHHRSWRYVMREGRDFTAFVENCTDSVRDPDGWKSFTRPQLDYLVDEDGAMLVDFVGRYESLGDDFAAVAERIGMAGAGLPHANHSDHVHYSSYYTPRTRALVAERFAPDLEAFGYSFVEGPTAEV